MDLICLYCSSTICHAHIKLRWNTLFYGILVIVQAVSVLGHTVHDSTTILVVSGMFVWFGKSCKEPFLSFSCSSSFFFMLQEMGSCVGCIKLASIFLLTPKFFLQMEIGNFSALYTSSKNILHVPLSSHIHSEYQQRDIISKKRLLFNIVNTLLNFKCNCLKR